MSKAVFAYLIVSSSLLATSTTLSQPDRDALNPRYFIEMALRTTDGYEKISLDPSITYINASSKISIHIVKDSIRQLLSKDNRWKTVNEQLLSYDKNNKDLLLKRDHNIDSLTAELNHLRS